MEMEAYYFYHTHKPLVVDKKPTGIVVFSRIRKHTFVDVNILQMKRKYFNIDYDTKWSDISWIRFPQMDKYYNGNHIMDFNNNENLSYIIEECKKYFNSNIFDIRIFLNDLIAKDARRFNLQMKERSFMTFRTAIGYCNKKLYDDNITEEEQNFLSLALVSLNRREPRPVKKYILTEFEDAKMTDYVCPMCNRLIQTTYNNNCVQPTTLFCPSCGQALNWSEFE